MNSLIALPNIISLFRMFLVLPACLNIIDHNFGTALLFFCLAAISDALDGFLARYLNLQTNLGKILDPVADKLLVIGIILALASENMLDYYYAFFPAILIVLREVLISGLRESISSYKISLEVTLLAKWKTTIQLIACGSFLVWRSNTLFYNIDVLGIISYILLWIAGIITFITGLQYIIKIMKFFKMETNRE